MKKRRLEEESMALKAPRCSILENVAISDKYSATDYSEKFKEIMKSAKPFPHISLRNFIDNSSNFVEQLETELQEFPNWRRKENDLYSLYQTTDFKNIPSTSQPNFFAFREFLSNVVKPWLEKVSGINLTDQIDITGSCYSETDNLLPHNDQIETRRFAFVYYLTEVGWSKTDGGALYLFNSDEQCMPTMIGAELLPYRNSFLLFEVTQRSWHQVAEILQGDRPRLSINGWFHSTRRLKEVVPPPEVIPRFLPVDLKVNHLNEFASLIYTENEKLKQINVLFEEESQVLLPTFFKPVSLKKITEALKKEQFQLCGPPNKRRIFRLKKEANAKNELGHFYGWLRSNYARGFFEKVTGCQLKGLHSSVEINRVERGCYTVMGDEDAAKSKEDGYILEIHFFFGDLIDFPADVGGSIYYVAKDDEEELMRINPQMNSAAIIFKEADVFSFIKYVTHKISNNFYIISLRYYNVEGDEENVT